MVLGLRTNNRKGAPVQVSYIIHIQEIKPWPPSQSLRFLRSVLLQWENGDRSSGSLSPVVPSLGSGVGDGKIEFNESFKLTVILSREVSARSSNADMFQKNCLELNLYEPRRDKTVKGQLLGSVMIDLAEYGIIRETVLLSIPMNCKRSFWNTAQPALYVKIQPFDRDSTSTSSRVRLLKEVSLDRDDRESVSAVMNEEYAEEAEIASFTDDDVSSHSSLTISSSAYETRTDSPTQNDKIVARKLHEKDASEILMASTGNGNGVPDLPLQSVPAKSAEKPFSFSASYASNQGVRHKNGSSSESSLIDLSSGSMNTENDKDSSNSLKRSLMLNTKISGNHHRQSTSASVVNEPTEEDIRSNNKTKSIHTDNLVTEVLRKPVVRESETKENVGNSLKEENNTNCNRVVQYSNRDIQVEKPNLLSMADSEFVQVEEVKSWRRRINGSVEGIYTNGKHEMVVDEIDEVKHVKNEQAEKTETCRSHSNEFEDRISSPPNNVSDASVSSIEQRQVNQQSRISQDALIKRATSGGDLHTMSWRGLAIKGNSFNSDGPKHVKLPVRSSLDPVGNAASMNDNQSTEEIKEINILKDARHGSRSIITDIASDFPESKSLSADKIKRISRERQSNASDGKLQQLERRIETLEAELRESAAIELSLYSVVAEHGSSAHKVLAPARRLSRLYLYASKQGSLENRASAARSIVSGLVLVAKACGNDVPRLTFWLSNSVVLRAIITDAVGDSHLPVSAGPQFELNGARKKDQSKSSSLRWNGFALNKKDEKEKFASNLIDWEDPQTFTSSLEKTEAWIFSRIIESVWWQTLTPHMQSATKEGENRIRLESRKTHGRKTSVGEQQQGNFSIDLWKKAFKDACERICPVRAGGHECGCLHMLARLVMEQCVARLDVAMFNAILRESDDEMPTDPISDPISDTMVLPIPAGKSSFGAGAQLKNALGNWSRWLADLFGIDYDDSLVDENEFDDERQDAAGSFKSFHLLNAFSDLLMLPKDMLFDGSIRKEVCPTFGAPLIKRVLKGFVPDEFCPDPIPLSVLETLDSEDPIDENEESIKHYPCNASSIVYTAPSAASVSTIIGDLGSHSQLRRSRSSVLRKCHTSDDELEELESPFASIVIDSIQMSPSFKATWKSKIRGANAARYQLLCEVWRDAD